MPRTRNDEAPVLVDTPVIKGRSVEPDDRCQCPHWQWCCPADSSALRDETYRAGDAFYAPPGHIPIVAACSETIDFSPSRELGETMAVVAANLAAAAAGAA